MKKTILTLFLSMSMFSSWGQSLQMKLITNNQQMVENAVQDAFSIIRQEFQLQDTCTGNRYNLDSLEYFGYSESICIKLKDGFITSRCISEPWNYDANISEFPNYHPVLSRLQVYNTDSAKWQNISPTPDYSDVRSIENTGKIIVRDSLFHNNGLSIGTINEDDEGWIVWIYRAGNKVSLRSFKQNAGTKDNLSTIKIQQPPTEDNLFCGILLAADYSEVGTIRFRMAALVEKVEDIWQAYPVMSLKKNVIELKLIEAKSPDTIPQNLDSIIVVPSKKRRK